MKNPKIGASLLSIPSFSLKEKIESLQKAGIDYLHIDIMDGNFVSNLAFPPKLYQEIYNLVPSIDFDLHFMVSDLAMTNLLDYYLVYPPKYITIHQEAIQDWCTIKKKAKKTNAKFGLAINPETPVTSIEKILPDIDIVLLMSVNPGQGGQKYFDITDAKLIQLNKLRQSMGLSFLIQIDGGINLSIAKKLTEIGVDLLVIGSDLVNSPDYQEYLKNLRNP